MCAWPSRGIEWAVCRKVVCAGSRLLRRGAAGCHQSGASSCRDGAVAIEEEGSSSYCFRSLFLSAVAPQGRGVVANRRDDWPLPPCIVRSRDTRGTVNTAGGCAHGRSRGNEVTLAAYFAPQARKTPSFSCAAFPPGPPLRPRRRSWLVRQSSGREGSESRRRRIRFGRDKRSRERDETGG